MRREAREKVKPGIRIAANSKHKQVSILLHLLLSRLQTLCTSSPPCCDTLHALTIAQQLRNGVSKNYYSRGGIERDHDGYRAEEATGSRIVHGQSFPRFRASIGVDFVD